MVRARPRKARRSRYNVSYRLTRSVPAAIVAVLLLAVLVGATLTYKRLDDFVNATTGHHINPIGEVVQAVEPAQGTIAYKLKHGQEVNILLLGMGGYENDAPYLTDSIMAVTIDPSSNRVMLASIPRDLTVQMNLQSPPSRTWTQKINAAYEVPYTNIICCVAPQYTGRTGGGYAAEHEVGKVTGLTFDKYIAVDFVAFRDMVNALGGVDVCLSTNLDDLSYPNYHNGYMPIHFKAGCQHLNGEQALEIARSRHAIQPQQASDFGRAQRQQNIMEAIKKKATTVNGFEKAPQLLDALQKNINTDMSISDMKAIYDWGKNLPDTSIIRVALTASSGAAPGNLLDYGNCGLGPYVSQLCADDPTFTMIHKYLASVLIDPKTLAEKAPVQFVNGSTSFSGLDSLVTTMFDPTGLQLADPVAHRPSAQTVILDYSGGKFPLTAAWLQSFFGGTVVAATPTNPAPAPGQQTYGLVVVLGHDFALRFLGE
ncbi:MAG TPA: LCP family protein [Candidatus Baltobacterales bacterium]|nr:LCP family protein [Candidatus Baltobacterales bacterium]